MSRMTNVNSLNDEGIECFTELIAARSSGIPSLDVSDLLGDLTLVEKTGFTGQIDLDKVFVNRFEMAKYIHSVIGSEYTDMYDQDIGLWSWFALVYFEQLIPAKGPNDKVHYIFVPTEAQRWYRHAVYTYFNLYMNYKDDAKLFISENITEMGNMIELLISRQYLMRSSAARKLMRTLYADPITGFAKVGCKTNPRKKNFYTKSGRLSTSGYGGIDRFCRIFHRLKLTYQVDNLDPDVFLDMMGDEFKKWK